MTPKAISTAESGRSRRVRGCRHAFVERSFLPAIHLGVIVVRSLKSCCNRRNIRFPDEGEVEPGSCLLRPPMSKPVIHNEDSTQMEWNVTMRGTTQTGSQKVSIMQQII